MVLGEATEVPVSLTRCQLQLLKARFELGRERELRCEAEEALQEERQLRREVEKELWGLRCDAEKEVQTEYELRRAAEEARAHAEEARSSTLQIAVAHLAEALRQMAALRADAERLAAALAKYEGPQAQKKEEPPPSSPPRRRRSRSPSRSRRRGDGRRSRSRDRDRPRPVEREKEQHHHQQRGLGGEGWRAAPGRCAFALAEPGAVERLAVALASLRIAGASAAERSAGPACSLSAPEQQHAPPPQGKADQQHPVSAAAPPPLQRSWRRVLGLVQDPGHGGALE